MAPTIAILSDIHANLEALSAVLSDIASNKVETVVCLGDIVGYGPNPCECVELAMTFSVCLMGDHDKLTVNGEAPRAEARHLIEWTRRQLGIAAHGNSDADRRRDFVRHLPLTYRDQRNHYMHGSPREPVHEYVFPESVFDTQRMNALFALVDRCCFIGHTHMPGIFTEQCGFFAPHEIEAKWQLRDDEKLLCNVGSVGQPRDEDPRACYCLFDGETIQFRRVEYDVDTTLRKINDLFPE